MSFSDKISWVGGMMGLFTGFSLISGLEILYWLWFKVMCLLSCHPLVGGVINIVHTVKILGLSQKKWYKGFYAKNVVPYICEDDI